VSFQQRVDDADEAVLAGVPLRRQIGYAALLLGIALLLAEGGMRLVFYLRGDLPPTPDESLTYEWKWARAKLASRSARESGPTLHSFDPDLGWRPTPGYEGDGVRINAQGLRADREYPPGPQPGRHRLALLGDSFTFGDHVANHQTYAWFLETRELSGWDVIDFAVNGYGTDQALLAYELFGGDLAADVVVMGFYVGDYERNVASFKLYAKPVFEPGPDGLRLTHHPVMPPEQLYEEYASGRRRVGEVHRPYLWLELAKSLERLRARWPSERDPEWTVLAALMRRFRDHVREQGAIPVWLVLPDRDVMSGSRSQTTRLEEMCEREAHALDLLVLRVDADFRAHARMHPEVPLYRPRELGGHFSEAGHRLVAERLADFLRARGVLDAVREREGFPEHP
jgi:hypothetical protein